MNNTTDGEKISWVMHAGYIGILLSRQLQNSDYQGQTIGFYNLQHAKNPGDTQYRNNPVGFAPSTGQNQRDRLFLLIGGKLPPNRAI
jgi:hypothetical protein